MRIHRCKIDNDIQYQLELVNEYINLDSLSETELLDLFWKADCLSFEDKQKLVTYLNAKGHNLKLFRGEVRGELHYTTEYFDGESWKKYKPNYENSVY